MTETFSRLLVMKTCTFSRYLKEVIFKFQNFLVFDQNETYPDKPLYVALNEYTEQ